MQQEEHAHSDRTQDCPDEDERAQLLSRDQNNVHGRVYHRRWYILVMFSFIASYEGAVSNFYNVIPHSARLLYGWNVADLAMISNWPPITTVVCTPLMMGLLSYKGLRASVLLCTAAILLATSLRCATLHSPNVLWFANIGAILVGVVSPILNAAQPAVASAWFSHTERVSATTISTVINNLAISSLLGLNLVRDCSDMAPSPAANASGHTSNCSDNATALMLIDHDVANMAYIECGVAGLCFLIVLAYYPSRPPSPPSISAAAARSRFSDGIRTLVRRKRIWLLAAVSGLSNGVYYNWLTLLPTIMQQVNIGQKEAAWLTFYASIGTIVSGVGFARVIDRLSGKIKWVVVFLFSAGFGSVLWITLQYNGVVLLTPGSIYVSVILAGTCIPATVSLLLEMACEAAYPTPEGVAGGLLVMCNNLVSVIFLMVFLVPDIGVSWMNWVMLGSMTTCICLMLPFKEKYTRLALDVAAASSGLGVQ